MMGGKSKTGKTTTGYDMSAKSKKKMPMASKKKAGMSKKKKM
jgi:hypothetical protein